MNKNVIYKIVCNTNSKFYIGRAANFDKRISIHKSRLRNNKHINKHMQNLWNKYGEECFQFLIIEQCEESNLIQREQYYLDLYIDNENCINISKSSNNNTSSNSPETRNKISLSNKGKKHSEESKALMSKARKGIVFNEETRKKIKDARSKQIMKSHTEETKKKISVANSGTNNSNAKLTWELVEQIRYDYKNGMRQKDLVVKYSLSFATISNIINNKRWKENDKHTNS